MEESILRIPKPKINGARPENWDLKPPAPADVELRDGAIRLILVPFFGILIPNLTGLFGSLGTGSVIYWIGYLYFILISFLVWQGNRFFLLKQREHFDWFDHPARKVVVLLFVNVFYTAPLAVSMLLGWYYLAGFPAPDWRAIQLATLAIVICVIFITHVYETVYLIQQRESDIVRFEKLERAKAEAELAALKTQIDPHFMFNSLNALAFLIEHHPEKALRFNNDLADVYRYILLNKSQKLVFLRDEIDFLKHYYSLLKLRFGEAIQVEFPGEMNTLDDYVLPPISLQVLLENAVKHNDFSEAEPLRVSVRLSYGVISISNEIRKKSEVRESAHIGLKNLDERYQLIMRKGISVEKAGGRFRVALPLLKSS